MENLYHILIGFYTKSSLQIPVDADILQQNEDKL